MIDHDAAVALKDAANALAEAEQHLRTAGNFSEGVVEAAAADYLSKKSAFDDAVDKIQEQDDKGDDDTPVADGGTPGPGDDEERSDLSGDPAASATGKDAGSNDHSDSTGDGDGADKTASGDGPGKEANARSGSTSKSK